jgi:hypothetical protein
VTENTLGLDISLISTHSIVYDNWITERRVRAWFVPKNVQTVKDLSSSVILRSFER